MYREAAAVTHSYIPARLLISEHMLKQLMMLLISTRVADKDKQVADIACLVVHTGRYGGQQIGHLVGNLFHIRIWLVSFQI